MTQSPRVLVWNEFRHERAKPAVRDVYPEGIHVVIAEALRSHGLAVQTATLDEPEHGLTEEALANTDTLVWWGHMAHEEVDDAIVERVSLRVLSGMGLVALHSAHYSKLFRRLMGTPCTVNWRDDGERERLWVVTPEHPIAQGIGPYIQLEREEMYGEVFGIPEPEELVFLSWFAGGEVFRSGCCFRRGFGRIFYFRPGHETFPTYHQPDIQRVIANACRWAAPNINAVLPTQNKRCAALEDVGV
jgi:trehalose utilization protein